ncbi:MAG: LysR family transcriptional regulator [Hyphomicrobiales bacterium]|nr:LysR family transcriptional regulator [Hyphomicrobiales bacterium]MBV8662279.1 LysR family transcriptional regulator [Hyphomicrobiales bacterium]
MLDTDQLRSFLAIVDTGSFTRAGERVNKTQSAVSMHIRRLEEQLGCALFVKQGRSAKLTDEGEKLIEYARHMIQIEAGAMAALSRNGLRGSVRLGMPDDYADAFLSGILTTFNRRHPLVGVSVVCENSVELAAQIKGGGIDIALVTDHEGVQGFELIREEPLVWVASKRFAPSRGAPVPLAVGSPSCLWRRVADNALRERPGATHGLFFSKNYSAIGTVVRAGLAATVLPIGMVGDDLRVLGQEDGLPPLPLTRMGLIRASGRQSPEAAALAEAIRDAIGAGTRKVA